MDGNRSYQSIWESVKIQTQHHITLMQRQCQAGVRTGTPDHHILRTGDLQGVTHGVHLAEIHGVIQGLADHTDRHTAEDHRMEADHRTEADPLMVADHRTEVDLQEVHRTEADLHTGAGHHMAAADHQEVVDHQDHPATIPPIGIYRKFHRHLIHPVVAHRHQDLQEDHRAPLGSGIPTKHEITFF